MLSILGMIILIIILFIFIIILLGIRLQFQWVKMDSEYDGCLKILILKKLKVYTFNLKSEDEEEEEEESDDDGLDFKEIYKLAKPCFKDLKIFIHEVFNAISINKFENHLVLGFASFAKTGEYIGYIWAVSGILNSVLPNTHLTSEPSFNGEVINFKGMANIDISIIKLIKPVISLLLKENVRELIKGVMNG